MASSGYLPASEFAFHDLYHFRLWSVLVCCQSSKAFHATRGVFAAPSPAGLRQRDTAATVGGGRHQRDGQCAGHWWERFGRPERCGKAGSSFGRSESRCIFKQNLQELFFKYPPGNWHIPPRRRKRKFILKSAKRFSDMLVLWRLMYQLIICQAWTAFNEFELKKNTTWFWIKKRNVS